jgi:hypothetical protein
VSSTAHITLTTQVEDYQSTHVSTRTPLSSASTLIYQHGRISITVLLGPVVVVVLGKRQGSEDIDGRSGFGGKGKQRQEWIVEHHGVDVLVSVDATSRIEHAAYDSVALKLIIMSPVGLDRLPSYTGYKSEKWYRPSQVRPFNVKVHLCRAPQ